MGTLRTTMAAMLAGLAFAAFHADISAQTRNSGGSGSSSQSRQQVQRSSSRPSSASSSRSTSASRSSSAVRPSAASRPTSDARPASGTSSSRPGKTVAPAARPSSGASSASQTDRTKPAARPANPSGAASRPSGQQFRPSAPASRPAAPAASPSGPKPGNRPQPGAGHPAPPHAPVAIHPNQRPDVHRVHPRDREFMHYSRPAYFWTGHNHCYGHRVKVLPAHVHRHIYHGVTYYCYNDIWYRPYGGYYVVCRPPFGTMLAAEIIADMTWAAVRFSHYNTVAYTYRQINENNEYIARQNELIAKNNAILAAQQKGLAMDSGTSWRLADELGLIQSYAAAGTNYYYQDGVFYVMDSDGKYKVIVPPAGALVETLPEDYDMITLKGNEYYKVDDTVYRVTISDGKPYFEVMGQLYS